MSVLSVPAAFTFLLLLSISYCQDDADQEFNPYVFRAVQLPFKARNYPGGFFGSDVAYIQSPLAATAKPQILVTPVTLPTIEPFTVRIDNLEDTHVDDENRWNFEKRVDQKVWWPNR
ncbi:Protein Y41E3.22 [Aphelenchoides avenae]|nr:Protein Y41E3.22 [Aphelenchus avenae]